jgi:hypothetical protein
LIIPARLACLLLLLAAGSCDAAALAADVDSKLGRQATSGKAPNDTGPEQRFNITRAVAHRYQGGLELAMQAVADARTRGRPLSPRLALLHDDIYPQLGWGEIRADNKMLAITSGRTDAPWGMVVAPDHPRLAEPGPTLRTGPDGGVLIVTIRPDAMSQRWAGIFMVHELSHLADHGTASDAIGCRAEHEAYKVEREIVNLLSDDRFDVALDTVLDDQGIRTASELQEMLASDTHDRLAAAISTIERLLEESLPLSTAEREMRDGFYVMALIERLGERAGDPEQARCLASESILRSSSKY